MVKVWSTEQGDDFKCEHCGAEYETTVRGALCAMPTKQPAKSAASNGKIELNICPSFTSKKKGD